MCSLRRPRAEGIGDIKATWAGVCGSVMLFVAAEIAGSHGKKKGVDKSVTGVLRRFVAAAEDNKRRLRSGVSAPLRRRAGKLFAHVLDVLSKGPPEFASDYTQMLRTHLLPVQEYCSRAGPCTIEFFSITLSNFLSFVAVCRCLPRTS